MNHMDRSEMMELYDAYTQLMKIEHTPRSSSRGVPCSRAHVNEELNEGKSISKAPIIFYLNRIVDEGVLGFRDATGKGGHHRIYITKLDESGYKKYIVRTLLESVVKDYPKETKEVIKSL